MGAAFSGNKGDPVDPEDRDKAAGEDRRPVDVAALEPVAVIQNSRERVVPPDEVAYLTPVPPNYLTREQLVDLSIMAASQPEPVYSPPVDKVDAYPLTPERKTDSEKVVEKRKVKKLGPGAQRKIVETTERTKETIIDDGQTNVVEEKEVRKTVVVTTEKYEDPHQKQQRAEEVAVAEKEQTVVLADLKQHDIWQSADIRQPPEVGKEQVILNTLPEQGLKVVAHREEVEQKKEQIPETMVQKMEQLPVERDISSRGATEALERQEKLEPLPVEKESSRRGADEARAHRRVKSSKKKRRSTTKSDKVVTRKHEVAKEEEPPIEVISPAKTPEKRKAETPVTTPTVSPLPRQHRMEGVFVKRQPPAISPAMVPPNALIEQQFAAQKAEPSTAKEARKEPAAVKKEPPPQELSQQKVSTTTTEKTTEKVVVKAHEKGEVEAPAKKKEPTVAAKEEEPPIEVISPAKTPEKRKAETPVTTPTVSPLPRQHRMEGVFVKRQPPAISPAMVPPNALIEQQFAAQKEKPSAAKEQAPKEEAPKKEVKEPSPGQERGTSRSADAAKSHNYNFR
ncbi:hypothetical protein OSTOST_04847 [Ostertagia ostertagi]